MYNAGGRKFMDFLESIMTSSSGQRVSPETLELLGKQASNMYREQGIPLNDAVKQVAANNPNLGNEHIKRIVEFANNVTFQEMFQSNPDKNIHFPVADPGVVIRDLKDGGSPAHDGKTLRGGMSDYSSPPSTPKNSTGDQEQMLSELFQNRNTAALNGGETGTNDVNPQMKLASAYNTDHALHANPVEDVYDTHIRLKAAQSELTGANERFDLLIKEAQEDLYQVIKREIIVPGGAGLGGVISVLEKIASKGAAFQVLESVIEQLSTDREVSGMLVSSFEKRAGKTVNWQHPLVHAWSGLVKAAEKKAETELALQEINGYLTKTESFLKTSGALTTSVKKAVLNRKPVQAAVQQRFKKA